ncbi:NAD(P)-binding protein [Rostrohypoxylon terebratum]|nr:NAD(P)-binding protein [Rostrohypoxylon terebratum]
MSRVAEAEIFPALKGKVAIVTGAAQGMGKATVEVFLKAGAKVVVCDIRKDGEKVAEELSKFGEVIFVQADISKLAEVQNLIEKTVAHFGRLHVAVNNAALAPDKTPLTDFDEDYWIKLTSVNLTGTAVCCKINAIAPGAIYSEMSAAALATMGTTEEAFTRSATLLNRFGMPHEVAQGSLWLCSDASSFVTGICLSIISTLNSQLEGSRRGTFLTTASTGIGAAIVRNLASKGCNIVVNYATKSSDEAASTICTELETAHSIKAIAIRADISRREECVQMIGTAKTHFENPETGELQIDILIHNAAIALRGPFQDIIEEDFERIYAVNVLGPILLTIACMPHLPTDRSGRIIMVSSINPKMGTPHSTLYSGTKAAIEAMARVWSRELAERATVNSINPGPVLTDMYLLVSDEMKRSLGTYTALTPLSSIRSSDSPEVREIGEKYGGRVAYDYEIAGIVGILCSPESGWCTGSLINANGGLVFSV